MSAGCEHGMPTPGSCVECMAEGNLAPPPRPAPPTVVQRLTARFPGHCRGCNLPIHEGQRIARLADETYRHNDCVGDVQEELTLG